MMGRNVNTSNFWLLLMDVFKGLLRNLRMIDVDVLEQLTDALNHVVLQLPTYRVPVTSCPHTLPLPMLKELLSSYIQNEPIEVTAAEYQQDNEEMMIHVQVECNLAKQVRTQSVHVTRSSEALRHQLLRAGQ